MEKDVKKKTFFGFSWWKFFIVLILLIIAYLLFVKVHGCEGGPCAPEYQKTILEILIVPMLGLDFNHFWPMLALGIVTIFYQYIIISAIFWVVRKIRNKN